MRSLNEIVTLRALDRIGELAKKAKVPEADAAHSIADRMALKLDADKHVVRRQLDRIFKGKTREGEREVTHRWRIDYLEAFADAAGVSVGSLITTAQGEPFIEKPTLGQKVFSVVGRAIDDDLAERAIAATRSALNNPHRYALMVAVSEALAAAPDQGAAISTLARLLISPEASAAFPEPKRGSSHSVKKTKRRS